MKKESTALDAVSRRIGERKYDSYMGGSMHPNGELSAAEVFSIIYGGEAETWQKDLDFHSERTFRRRVRGAP